MCGSLTFSSTKLSPDNTGSIKQEVCSCDLCFGINEIDAIEAPLPCCDTGSCRKSEAMDSKHSMILGSSQELLTLDVIASQSCHRLQRFNDLRGQFTRGEFDKL